MRVLIVGCGYVGLRLGSELARQGHEVFGLRRNPAAEPELNQAGIRPLFADIANSAALRGLPMNYDWVVNCAGASQGGAEEYRRVYLEGTRNLLAWLDTARPAKFVHTGSTSVYGQDDGSSVDESSPAEPVAATAKILIETERLLIRAARQSAFPAALLRVAGIYGPGRGYWLRQFLKDKARVDGSGARFLNMIHRDDVAGAITAALEKGRPGEIYNACDDEPVAQIRLLEWLADTLGRPMPPSELENPAARKRGATNKRISNHKLKMELGYRFKYPTFREGYGAVLRGQT